MSVHKHNHSQKNGHHEEDHEHTHGAIDATLATTSRGIWAIKWSFIGLMITALFQLVIVFFTGSVALLADTIHNFGDAATAIPLLIAFLFARKKANKVFTYGYGKVEDLAGVIIVVMMLLSAVVAGYEAINRLFNPQPVSYVWAVVAASIIGFIGNEAVAIFRIRVGKEINSAALIADGYHARADGFTSLAVLGGAVGVLLGFPLADPIVGLLITFAILKIVWESGKSVFTRLLDGVDPKVVDEIKHAAEHVQGVVGVTETRVRWIGHRIHAELNVAVDQNLSVTKGHDIANAIYIELRDHLPYLSNASIHIDPAHSSGEKYHFTKNDDVHHNEHKH